MRRLILLDGIGINGKTYIIDRLMDEYSDRLIHLPQTNRKYFDEHPETACSPSQEDLYSYFIENSWSKIKDYPEDVIIISERHPLSYYGYTKAVNHDYSVDPHVKQLEDLVGVMDDCVVDIFKMENLDVLWLGVYFSSLDSDDVHKLCYKGRGMYISMSDAYRRHVDLQLSKISYGYVSIHKPVLTTNLIASADLVFEKIKSIIDGIKN